jgi:hypothetical protein
VQTRIVIAVIISMLTAIYSACEFGADDTSVSNVSISGVVVDSLSGNPVTNATVRLTDGVTQVNVVTGADGKFTASLSLAGDRDVTLIASKEGYTVDTLKIFVIAGSTVTVPPIQIRDIRGGGGSSGTPASLYMYFQSSQSVGVRESGSNETAQIIFEVLDALGVPIGLNNSVVLQFSFGTSPGGGEFLYPASAQTNTLGRASVTLNAGTKAGAVQVIAQMIVNGNVIKSRPVLMAIHGGLPVQEHFDVACPKLNYPLYGIIGAEIDFTAFLGDRYTNPVRPGTIAYFTTTSGIVAGSAQTDDLGRATATLLTHGSPDFPPYGRGFFQVTASTINENNTRIQTATVRLLSGLPSISVSPPAIDIQNNSSQLFNFTVRDQNGNPLSEGTSIAVSVSEGNVGVTGSINVRLPDTQSSAYTIFSFTAYDSKPDTSFAKRAIIKIATTGPNGDAQVEISGTSR